MTKAAPLNRQSPDPPAPQSKPLTAPMSLSASDNLTVPLAVFQLVLRPGIPFY